MNLSLIGLGILIVILILALRAIIHIVPEYQRLIVFRLGSFEKTAGPGIVLLLPPPIQSVAQTVDLRELAVGIPQPTCITNDTAPTPIASWRNARRTGQGYPFAIVPCKDRRRVPRDRVFRVRSWGKAVWQSLAFLIVGHDVSSDAPLTFQVSALLACFENLTILVLSTLPQQRGAPPTAYRRRFL